ncbi:MAG: site-specific DNA-methyltransferase [Deltaproteobacteria bacterium]|jgi:adenine-specific DNA-methyltransferase|nr:site-specific DNA-methyltransferase [Deltaproteobacteria bacterium]
MEKLSLTSKDLVQDNIDRLRELYPHCVTLDANGREVVDFPRLKEELKDFIGENNPERYGLTWPGKKEAIKAALTPTTETLSPNIPESLEFFRTSNLFLEGDNLEILKLLLNGYQNKIKLIYIDPPYNTGSDLIYRDAFKETLSSYLIKADRQDLFGNRLVANVEGNGRFHSNWLSMMHPRLKLARALLKEDGAIFMSVDDHEAASLKKIAEEIFGERNFLAQACVKGSGGRQDSRHFAVVHSYLLIFAKNIETFVAGLKPKCLAPIDPAAPEKAAYARRPLRKWGDSARAEDRPNLYYPIKDPDGHDLYPTLSDGSKGRWRWGQEKTRQAILQDAIVFKRVTRNGQEVWEAFEKVYPNANPMKFSTWIDNIGVSQAIGSIKALFGGKIFDYPKSLDLIKLVLAMGHTGDDDIILDFFAGSATTGHAVALSNLADGAERRFILVQYPEAVGEKAPAYKLGLTDIAAIAKERLRRAAQEILDSPKDPKTTADPKDLDLGFRVLKLVSPNSNDPVSPWDRLFQVILALGLDLAAPILEETVILDEIAYQLFTVGDNQLIASFDLGLTENLPAHVAVQKPANAVFLDAAFSRDDIKLNVQHIFRCLAPLTNLKTI